MDTIVRMGLQEPLHAKDNVSTIEGMRGCLCVFNDLIICTDFALTILDYSYKMSND